MISRLDLSKLKTPPDNNFVSHDIVIAKNIINILFTFINNNIKNDKKMSGFTKSLILSQLPGIKSGSKEQLNEMNSFEIKQLLNDIQNQINQK